MHSDLFIAVLEFLNRISGRDPLTTNTIACKWQRHAKGWRLWVKGRKHIGGTGSTYEEAEAQLIDAIWEAANDLDAVIPTVPEYDPPLPPPAFAKQFLSPELFLISGDEIFELNRPSHAEVESHSSREAYLNTLFTDGYCPVCHLGQGTRTDYSPTRRLRSTRCGCRMDTCSISSNYPYLFRAISRSSSTRRTATAAPSTN